MEQEILYLLLEARGVGCIWRRLQARHLKETAAACAGTATRSPSEGLSFNYLFSLSGSAIVEICKGEHALAQEVISVSRQLSKLSNEDRNKAIGMDYGVVQEQVCHVNTLLQHVAAPTCNAMLASSC